MTEEEKTVPCGTCGEPTTMLGTKRCHNCWEVESRLNQYLSRGKMRAQTVLVAALKRYVALNPVKR